MICLLLVTTTFYSTRQQKEALPKWKELSHLKPTELEHLPLLLKKKKKSLLEKKELEVILMVA